MDVSSENIKISDLRPAEYNPRKITRAHMNDLKRSLESDPDFLLVSPIVVNRYPGRENVIVSGHQRVEAAKELGWTVIRCLVVNVDQKTEKAWNVRFNTHAGQFERDVLSELVNDDPSIFEHVMNGDELDDLLNDYQKDEPEEAQIEAVADREAPITAKGDVWQLGDHVLVCGDSTDSETYKTLLGDEKADMCFTDPPYNVAIGSSMKDKLRNTERTIANDDLSNGEWHTFVDGFMSRIRERTKGAVYICMSTKEWPTVQAAFVRNGFHWSDTLIWVKSGFTIGRSDYQRMHEPILVGKAPKQSIGSEKAEPILYGWPEGEKHKWNGGRDEADAWFFKKPPTNPIHPTMKPVELVAKAIAHSSDRGDMVLEPFAGGGVRSSPANG